MEILYGILGGTIFGWLLGIISPFIIKKISEKSERDNLEKIIFNDLRDLKKRLAPLSFQVYPKYGKLDIETFKWLEINSGIDFSEGLEKLYEEGVNLDQVLLNFNTLGLKKNTHTYFKKMHLFAIDSHLINFGLIDNNLMGKILEIRFHTEAFNEEVDSFREFFKMTFLPGITEINHKIISQEIKNKSLIIAKKSMFIVDKINDILENQE